MGTISDELTPTVDRPFYANRHRPRPAKMDVILTRRSTDKSKSTKRSKDRKKKYSLTDDCLQGASSADESHAKPANILAGGWVFVNDSAEAPQLEPRRSVWWWLASVLTTGGRRS